MAELAEAAIQRDIIIIEDDVYGVFSFNEPFLPITAIEGMREQTITIGSFYLFVNIKKTGLSSTEVCKRLLEEAHVLAVQGNAFGKSGEGYIRIACTVGLDKLKLAFDRIEGMEIFKD